MCSRSESERCNNCSVVRGEKDLPCDPGSELRLQQQSDGERKEVEHSKQGLGQRGKKSSQNVLRMQFNLNQPVRCTIIRTVVLFIWLTELFHKKRRYPARERSPSRNVPTAPGQHLASPRICSRVESCCCVCNSNWVFAEPAPKSGRSSSKIKREHQQYFA